MFIFLFHPILEMLLDTNASDHLPLKKDGCWRRFVEVVERSWTNSHGVGPFQLLWNKLENTRESLEKWSLEHFGNLQKDIEIGRIFFGDRGRRYSG